MKTLHNLIMIICLLVMATGCRHDKHRYVTSDGTNRLEVEYSGKVIFDQDLSVSSMSRQSYFRVDRNGETVVVKCNYKGEVIYIDNEGEEKAKPDADDNKLLAEGIRLITNTRKGLGKR